MRVAYVCMDPGIPVFGTKGCSIHVQEVVRAMRDWRATPPTNEERLEVTLFASRKGGEPPPGLEDLDLRLLPIDGNGDPAERERAARTANRALAIALAAEGPWDLIYERHSLWSHAAMRHAAHEGIPGILEVNAPLIDEHRKHRGLADPIGAASVACDVMRMASTVIAVSPRVAEYAMRWRGESRGIEIVPNGVSPRRYTPRYGTTTCPVASHPERRVIGFVGSLRPWHGLEDLARAFSKMHARDRHSRLLIVGDGPAKDAFWNQLDPKAHAATQLVGAVPHASIPEWLQRMDVAVAPYPRMADFYFSPLKIMEYMAAGLPTVASHNGDLADWVRHAQSGWIYTPGDIEGLTDALELLASDFNLRAQLGRAARDCITAEHTWDHVVQRILQCAQGNSIPPLVRTA